MKNQKKEIKTTELNLSKCKVPKERKKLKRLSPKMVMLYYKIDDSCNFQTLAIDSYGSITTIPCVVLGRFKGEKAYSNENKSYWFINEIETKAFSLYPYKVNCKEKDIGFKVINVVLHAKSNSNKVIFYLVVEETCKNNRDNRQIDYVYRVNPGKNRIPINNGAEIEFRIVTEIEGKPSGDYECNGKVIFGRSN